MFSFIKNRKERELANKQLTLIQSYKRVFESADGQVVLSDLLQMCGVTMSSIDLDTNTTFYNEGKRFVGMHILSNIEATESKLRELFRQRYSTIEDMEGEYNE